MKKSLSTIVLLLLILVVEAQNILPKVLYGEIKRIENFESKYITSRNIDVWIPEDYSELQKYSVLYVHDGQMLFDPENSWNKQAWNIDDVVSELSKSNKIKKVIIVGIWNGGETRHSDYFPQKPYEFLSTIQKDTINAQLRRSHIPIKKSFYPQSNDYLKFLIEELKPYVDSTYSVYSDRKNTYIMGSSMGGLISVYAICEYPEIFGGAACLSTHWAGTFTLNNNPIPDAFIKYLSKSLPSPRSHKIYFDYGDQTLDKLYPEIQKKIDKLMTIKGYDENNWITKFFPGENHSEDAWGKRLNVPLEFLLKNSLRN